MDRERVMPDAGVDGRILADPDVGAFPKDTLCTLCSLPLAAIFEMQMPKCCFAKQLHPSFPDH